MTANKQTADKPIKTPRADAAALGHAQKLITYLQAEGATFYQTDGEPDAQLNSSLFVISRGEHIPLLSGNDALNRLFSTILGITSSGSAESVKTVALLRAHASTLAASVIPAQLGWFTSDGSALIMPSAEAGKAIRVTSQGMTLVKNGSKDASGIQIGGRPVKLSNPPDPFDGTRVLEGLLTNRVPAEEPWRWFVTMLPIFALSRSAISTRPLVQFVAPSQTGKSTLCQKILCTLGNFDRRGKYVHNFLSNASVAGARSVGDCGMLVLDNRESASINNSWAEHLLVVSSGGVHTRSTIAGQTRSVSNHPMYLLSSIEGIELSRELRTRVLTVPLEPTRRSDVGGLVLQTLAEIDDRFNLFMGAFAAVIQDFLAHGGLHEEKSCPVTQTETFSLLACLTRSYGRVSRRPEDWAESLIAEWRVCMAGGDSDFAADELEDAIVSAIRHQGLFWQREFFTRGGIDGYIYTTSCSQILDALKHDPTLSRIRPKSSNQLSRRLHTMRPTTIELLFDEADHHTLRRAAGHRKVGIFVPAELAKEFVLDGTVQ